LNKVKKMRTTIPIISQIQWTFGNDDQAYMNIPMGKNTPATHGT
jgi:hypothetical protein